MRMRANLAAAVSWYKEWNRPARDKELEPFAERLGLSYTPGYVDCRYRSTQPPLDAAILPKYEPTFSERRMQGYRHHRWWVTVFDCTSKKDHGYVMLKWLLSADDDLERFFFSYTCAALRAESPLPDCALLRSGVGWELFRPSSYGLRSTREVDGALGWLLADNSPPFSPPVFLPELAEWLPSVDRRFHSRVRGEWVVCVTGGDEPAYCPGYQIVEMLKAVEEFARRVDAFADSLISIGVPGVGLPRLVRSRPLAYGPQGPRQ